MSKSRSKEDEEIGNIYSDDLIISDPQHQSQASALASTAISNQPNQQQNLNDDSFQFPQPAAQLSPPNGSNLTQDQNQNQNQNQNQSRNQQGNQFRVEGEEEEVDQRAAAPDSASSSSLHSPPSTPIINPDLDLDEFQNEFWNYHMQLVERAPLAQPLTSTSTSTSSNQTSNQSTPNQRKQGSSTVGNAASNDLSDPRKEEKQLESSQEGEGDGNDKDWEEIEVKKKEKRQRKESKWKGKSLNFKPGPGQLPLARIKKVMKLDEEVEMISAEAPILFARASEIFIADLTARAFMMAQQSKRRTIQRADIAAAISTSDLFDFLVDIIPMNEMTDKVARNKSGAGDGGSSNNRTKPSVAASTSSTSSSTLDQVSTNEQNSTNPDPNPNPRASHQSATDDQYSQHGRHYPAMNIPSTSS